MLPNGFVPNKNKLTSAKGTPSYLEYLRLFGVNPNNFTNKSGGFKDEILCCATFMGIKFSASEGSRVIKMIDESGERIEISLKDIF
jgi:hypothetical protein